jgi:hypothetical protein
MLIFRYFWFFCAAAMAVNVVMWQRRLRASGPATITPEETRRFTRAMAFWLVAPCLVLGLIVLMAGWTDPFCAGFLSFHDAPSAATTLVTLGAWMSFLGWVWFGRGATLLSRVASALWTRRRTITPAEIQLAATAVIVVAAVGGMIASRQVRRSENPCALTQIAGNAELPGLQLLLLGLSAATWLIGGNLIVARHYRRMGKSHWSGFEPFAFPFKDFNTAEWLSLLALLILALGFGAIAVSLNSP